MINRVFSINLDFLGMTASLLCAIHCALLPIIVSISAVTHQDHFWHQILDFIFLPVAILLIAYSLVNSIKKHQKSLPIILAVIGLILFFIGKLFYHQPHFIFTTAGGLTIAVAHFQNWTLLKRYHQKNKL